MKACILLQLDVVIVLNQEAAVFKDLFDSLCTFLSLFFGS